MHVLKAACKTEPHARRSCNMLTSSTMQGYHTFDKTWNDLWLTSKEMLFYLKMKARGKLVLFKFGQVIKQNMLKQYQGLYKINLKHF